MLARRLPGMPWIENPPCTMFGAVRRLTSSVRPSVEWEDRRLVYFAALLLQDSLVSSQMQRLAGAIASDEKDAIKEYVSLTEQGRHFVDVYVPEESDVAEVESILETHQAHDMHYYGEWDLVDLSSNQPPR